RAGPRALRDRPASLRGRPPARDRAGARARALLGNRGRARGARCEPPARRPRRRREPVSGGLTSGASRIALAEDARGIAAQPARGTHARADRRLDTPGADRIPRPVAREEEVVEAGLVAPQP